MKIHPKNVKTFVIAAADGNNCLTSHNFGRIVLEISTVPPRFMLEIPMQSMANNYYNNIEQVEGGIFYFQHFSPGLHFDPTSNKPIL